MTTQDEREDRIEKDINRLLERIQDAATVDDGIEYAAEENATLEDLQHRLMTLEKLKEALLYKIQLLEKRGVL